MNKIILSVVGFAVAALWFSLARDSELGYLIKILPIVILFGLALQAPKGIATGLVLIALAISSIGDLVLELGFTQIGVGIFVIVMSIYSVYFYRSCRQPSGWCLIFWMLLSGVTYGALFPHLVDAQWSGALYQCVICLMMWRASAVLISPSRPRRERLLVFAGALGVALNGVLYAVDLYLMSINRDLVIQLYYWGQLAIVLSLFYGSHSNRVKEGAVDSSSTVQSR